MAAAKKLVVARKVHNVKSRRLQDISTIGTPDKNGIITITDQTCFLERCKFCLEIFFDAKKCKLHTTICPKKPVCSKTVKL